MPNSQPSCRVLIVDDEDVARLGLQKILSHRDDLVIDLAADGKQGLEMALAADPPYDIVLTDYSMPRMDGMALLGKILEERPLTRVIIVTGRGSVETAVDALKRGAYDFIQKPFDITVIRAVVDRALREKKLAEENLYLRQELSRHQETEDGVIWEDSRMKDILLLISKIGPTANPILIEGESGVGKELLARKIHASSKVAGQKFMAINCGAFAEDILVSELFGYEKGAFTGAEQRKAGIFESVEGGTIFFDEIGELPYAMQSRFLRVLQEKEFYRLGGRDLVKADFRLIAATNKNLKGLVEQGKFREDLYYRIRVHYILVPPLRDRYADIAPLTNFFIRRYRTLEDRPVDGISRDALAYLQSYHWPGNVRELENVIREMVVTTESDFIGEEDVPGYLKGELKGSTEMLTLEEVKLNYIRDVLRQVNGNRTQAAKILGLPRITLQRLLARHKNLAEIK